MTTATSVARPYIGITGFMQRAEVEQVLEAFPGNSRHLLMVGVLVSSKTLGGQKNKYPEKYPLVENVQNIFFDHPLALNLIHYNTDTRENLVAELEKLIGLGGPDLHGFQLNIAWPDPEHLRQFHACQPYKYQIVLQIGSRALAAIGAEGITEKLKPYVGLIDYILIDPSGGFGKPLDPNTVLPLLQEISGADLGIGLGAAGGFCAETVPALVGPIAQEIENLSIDAEGKVAAMNDRLNYVKVSLDILGKGS